MKYAAFAAGLSLLMTVPAVAADKTAVQYRLDLRAPAHQLGRAEVRFPAVTGAYLDIKLPNWRTGKYKLLDLASGLRDFKAFDAEGQALPVVKIDKSTWRVTLSRPTAVTVRYEVYANRLAERVHHIDDSHAFLDASGVFVYAEPFRSKPLKVTLDVPAGWESRSGMDSAGAHGFKAPNYDVLIDSPIETGLHEFRRFKAGNTEQELVIWGKGNYNIETIETDLGKLVPKAGALWGSYPFKRYVWMVHSAAGLRGATEHLNSTIISKDRWSFAPREEYLKFIRTAAHELVHTWNVKAYRPDHLVPYDYDKENYTRLLWVAEGTTSYFESLLVLRAGVQTPKELLKEWAALIERHQNRPGRKQMSVAEASFDEWIEGINSDRDNNASVSIYDQGELVSLLLDLAIRERTDNARGLEDVHRLLYQRFPATSKGYTESDFKALLTEVAGGDFEDFWTRYISGTEELPLAESLGKAGLELSYVADKDDSSVGPTPFSGIKVKSSHGQALLDQVQRDAPAWKAGLSAGDVLVAIDGLRVDPDKAETRLKELKAGQPVKLSYFRNDVLRETVLTPTGVPKGKLTLKTKANASPAQKALYEAWTGTAWPQSKS